MHYRMLVTLTSPLDADSETVRRHAYDLLASDDSFCGKGGRFGYPLCDWFVIGGRWSGLFAATTMSVAHRDAAHEHFRELAGDSYPRSLVEQQRAELDAFWRRHGRTGPNPYRRSASERLGHADDAMLLTQSLYDALLSEYARHMRDRESYADLDGGELDPDFVGRKWLVVIDYHN